MKIYQMPNPKKVKALIFDMDLTLYTSEEYGRQQIDGLVEKLASVKGRSPSPSSIEELAREIEEHRRSWAAAHNGAALSMSHVFTLFYGVSMEENIRWREEVYTPERYLRKDPRLKEALQKLRELFALALVTNNTVSIAKRTLAAIGAEEFFPVPFIVGLDTCNAAKPDKRPFYRAAELLGLLPENCVSVGDRYDVDIALPLEMGMGGILVEGVEEVYSLPEVFREKDP
ncbi:haloacid dehalogenase [Spirochaetia bacterium]|nr:haloacid dehalogenase [Spirochaetia bacterium]